MIETSAAYKLAITADSRRILLRAVVDLISPDIVYGTVTSSGETIYSKSAQLHDKVFELGAPFATLERSRWALDGTWQIAPPDSEAQVGFESSALFDENGEGYEFVRMPFTGVSILQSCSIYFPDKDYDGLPVDFTISVIGDTTYIETFTDNNAALVSLDGFTVNNPTAITISVTKWSLPYRRVRIPEIIPGIYEIWGNDLMAELSVTQQAAFTGLSVPYGTCQVSIDNSDGRFSPRNKTGLFESIEDRQGIGIYIAPEGAEYIPFGVYYQYSGGWKSSSNGLTMTWTLVDIIGLLVKRKFSVPETLPVTLDGWVASLVAQLGVNFSGHYSVPDNKASLSLTATAADVADKTCGQILMWLCQASETWPHAAAEDGCLALENLPSEATNSINLDNMTVYPVSRANDDVARLEFTLPNDSVVSVPGNSEASPNTYSIDNPFIKTAAAAQAAGATMLNGFGGNLIETTGRGDPSNELGDILNVELKGGETVATRLMYQCLRIQSGVMQGCQSKLLEIMG